MLKKSFGRLLLSFTLVVVWLMQFIRGSLYETNTLRTLGFPIDIFECAWSNSGLDIARGFATRAGRVDVGARARQLQARRLWTIALSGTAVAGFVIVILNTFQENLMFYITPSQVWACLSRQITLLWRSLECIKSEIWCRRATVRMSQ